MIPIIESVDNNKPTKGIKTVYRDSIMLVVKHPTKETYLYLHNKKFDWKILVQGGINPGENEIIAAVRELIDETGYNDIKSIIKLDFEMDNVYYAAHKNENRYAMIKTFYIELKTLRRDVSEEGVDVLFDTYENLCDLFGDNFKHHYYLLGIAIGKEKAIVNKDKTKLGRHKLNNLVVSYRNKKDNPVK